MSSSNIDIRLRGDYIEMCPNTEVFICLAIEIAIMLLEPVTPCTDEHLMRDIDTYLNVAFLRISVLFKLLKPHNKNEPSTK